jgi:hypothetical protein
LHPYCTPIAPLQRLNPFIQAIRGAVQTFLFGLEDELVCLVMELPRALQRDERAAPVLREQLDLLVAAVTWKRTGESFEFAHFTDLQIARAIDRLDRRRRKPTLKRLTQLIAETRIRQGKLGDHLHGVSKLDLADELWPILERRLERAKPRRTDAARRAFRSSECSTVRWSSRTSSATAGSSSRSSRRRDHRRRRRR